MRAAVFNAFEGPITIENVPDPAPAAHGVVLRVQATGVCRSDWHAWMGHFPEVPLPHVAGHEIAGVVVATGSAVRRWEPEARVTLPFVCGCGTCPDCAAGDQQVCAQQFQPGYSRWGSFAEYVAIDYADMNLVRIPDTMDDVTAASLGCRFASSSRAVVDQGRVTAGQWVAVHGCGGVGLSAIMIAGALGANVVAVDIAPDKLAFAHSVGAAATVNAAENDRVAEQIRDMTGGGVHLSIDALGSPATSFNSIACLRKRGRHVQVGLLLADQRRPPVPMDKIVADELEILGSHGIQAHRYPAMLAMIQAGKLAPRKLISKTIHLDQVAAELDGMGRFAGTGVAVIDRFD